MDKKKTQESRFVSENSEGLFVEKDKKEMSNEEISKRLDKIEAMLAKITTKDK